MPGSADEQRCSTGISSAERHMTGRVVRNDFSAALLGYGCNKAGLPRLTANSRCCTLVNSPDSLP